MSAVERLRSFLSRPEPSEYEPLAGGVDDDETIQDVGVPFSWMEYSIFLMLGVAMLWAWNMFLAAFPYFQGRFIEDAWIATHFQSAIISVATAMNLSSMLILTKRQSQANYPKRIITALIINSTVFVLLMLSTVQTTSAKPYFAFTLVIVVFAAAASGFLQNGVFAFASSFARPEYIQAVMAGQGIAGVLPCIAQIVAILSAPEPDHWGDDDGPSGISIAAAFNFFLTSVVLSLVALVAFVPLVRRHRRLQAGKVSESTTSIVSLASRHPIGFVALYKKLGWLALAIFLCFAVTMFFPVFTSQVLSVHPPDEASRLLQPATFVPLAILLWNIGDLAGRISTSHPFFLVKNRLVIVTVAVLRAGFLPMYLLCNLRGEGAIVSSDFFYLFIIQLCFGATNGWLCSVCMMTAGEWVASNELEAAGSFMGLNLVAGLTVGSLLSFLAAP